MTENTRPLRDFFQSLPSGSPGRLVGTDLTTINVSDIITVGIDGVAAGHGISINPAEPRLPEISLDGGAIYSLSLADSAVQPGDLGGLATKDRVSVPAEIDAGGAPGPTTYLRGDGVWASITGGGSVTSVGLSTPTGFSVSGSPVTSAGTIAISYSAGYQGYTTAEANKLSGVASGATANQPDAYLLNRANHTGAQAISTVTGLQTALDDKALQATTISAGTGLTGGGTLAANRSIALSSTSIASLALADTAVQPSDLGDLAYIDFPASPSGNVLNDSGNWVPQGGGSGGGGQVNSVQPGAGISVNSSDPVNPSVSLSAGTQSSLSLADSALQPSSIGVSVQGYSAVLSATTASFTTALNSKLSGIEAGAQVNTVTSVAGKAGAVVLAKGDVGLANVDNTSDLNKPISTATQAALNGKAGTAVATTSANGLMSSADKTKLNGIAAGATANTGTVTSVAASVPTGFSVGGSPITGSGTLAITYATGYQGYTTAEANKLSGIEAGAQVNTVTSVAGKTGAVVLAKGDVGLGNVDNTSDAAKPVSTAQQNALNGKANLSGGNSFSGTQRGNITALSVSSGSIAWNLANGNDFTVTLTENATLSLPTGIATHVGQKGRILVSQDGTGGRTLAVNANIIPLGSAEVPSIPTGPNAKAYLAYDVISASQIVFTLAGVGE